MKPNASFLVAALCVVILAPFFASAQQAPLSVFPSSPAQEVIKPASAFLTWEAETETPSWYIGRALPIAGSKIKASLLLLDSEGKMMPSTGNKIRWFANYIQLQDSQDKTQTTLTVPDYYFGEMLVRATVFSSSGVVAEAQASIPVARPKIVLSIPYPARVVPIEEAVMQAVPYFFPKKESDQLNYSWRIGSASLPSQSLFGSFAVAHFSGEGLNVPVTVSARSLSDASLQASTQSIISIR